MAKRFASLPCALSCGEEEPDDNVGTESFGFPFSAEEGALGDEATEWAMCFFTAVH